MELITQAEYARRRGCSAVAVHLAIKAGRIALTEGKIDPVAADAAWSSRSMARQGSKPALHIVGEAQSSANERPRAETRRVQQARMTPDYQESRARREAADADIAEMKAAELRGSLVQADAVKAQYAKVMAGIRDSLLGIPGRLAPVLAAETDVRKAQAILDAEIRATIGAAINGA